MLNPGEISKETESARKTLEQVKSRYSEATDELDDLERRLTRVTTRFAVHILGTANFHQLDEEISAGNLDPRFAPLVASSMEIADTTFFPENLEELVTSIRENLDELEEAIVKKNQEDAEELAHEVHMLEHELSHASDEWLSKMSP